MPAIFKIALLILVQHLLKAGLFEADSLVCAALEDQLVDVSERTVQRRVKQVTGLTQGQIHQIDRAQRAFALLQSGMPILDTVFEAGFADQAHLTRSLKRFVGQTPGQIIPFLAK